MRRTHKFILLAVVILFFGVSFHYYDPTHSVLALRCPFRMLTGYDCPGCGSQRALHCFMNGRIWEGIQHNYLLLPLLVYALLLVVVPRDRKFYHIITSSTACWVLLAVILLWWILRNVFGV